MTITPSMMYWFTRLDGINGFFEATMILTCLAGLVFFVITIYLFLEEGLPEKDDEGLILVKRAWRWWFTVLAISTLGAIFIPTSKQMAMIYVVPSITESQVVKQDIPELYDLGVDALKDWLKNNKKEGGK